MYCILTLEKDGFQYADIFVAYSTYKIGDTFQGFCRSHYNIRNVQYFPTIDEATKILFPLREQLLESNLQKDATFTARKRYVEISPQKARRSA